MRFFYFLHKIVGAEAGAVEQWHRIASAEVRPPLTDLDARAATQAISTMSAWGDRLLADHRGYYELFNLCTASMSEDGAPDVVLAEEFRLLTEGDRVNTAEVEDTRSGTAHQVAPRDAAPRAGQRTALDELTRTAAEDGTYDDIDEFVQTR